MEAVFIDSRKNLCYIVDKQIKGSSEYPLRIYLKPTADAERHPYQMRQQDFYCDRCHNKSLFFFAESVVNLLTDDGN